MLTTNQINSRLNNNLCIEIPSSFVLRRDFNISLSFDKIKGFFPSDCKNRANAIYGKSFGGEISNAPGINCSNLDKGTNSICDSILFNSFIISNLESLDFLRLKKYCVLFLWINFQEQ